LIAAFPHQPCALVFVSSFFSFFNPFLPSIWRAGKEGRTGRKNKASCFFSLCVSVIVERYFVAREDRAGKKGKQIIKLHQPTVWHKANTNNLNLIF
jgi:hypothetical protein